MTKAKKSRSFFLLSFLPALTYWYLETHYSLKIALMGGMTLAFIEMLLEKILLKHVHSISKINLSIIVVLGLLSLLGNDGILFKMQPLFTGMILGGILYIQNIRGKSILWIMMKDLQSHHSPPQFLIEKMERHLSIFISLYGLFMGAVALAGSTSQWLFFKTFGFYLAFALFFLLEIILLKRIGMIKKAKVLLDQQNGRVRLNQSFEE